MAERHGRVLGELAELGLSLARDLHARALAAEEPQAAERLAIAFHRISRTVRQSLALEAKLERDRVRAAADRVQAEEAERAAAARRVEVRKAELKAAVTRLAWEEAETYADDDDLWTDLVVEDLDAALEREAEAPDFTGQPMKAQAARLYAALKAAIPPEAWGGETPPWDLPAAAAPIDASG